MTTTLSKGANAPLPDRLCRVTLTAAGEIDVCAVLLGQDGRVRGDHDLVFYNHPAQEGVSLAGRTISADLAAVPASVHRVAVVAGVDPRLPNVRFDAASTPRVDIDCGGVRLAFVPPPFVDGETAAILVELYRRAGAWKVRAVGQGWDTGLAGLATDFGVVVDDDGTGATPAAAVSGSPRAQAQAQAHAQVPAQAQAPAQVPVPARKPAISLDKVQTVAPELVSLYKAAEVSLAKTGLTGQRAAVYLVLDHSGSMGGFYANGTMQHLAEQALGLSANLDDDGIVPLVFFSNRVDLVTDISLDNYRGRIDRLHRSLDWGGTCYAPAMQSVIDHYLASGATDPAFVIFQTDGEPFDRRQTRDLLRKSSSLPIFWQFVGFGSSRDLRFLRSLDTLDGRTVDNAGFFAAGQRPTSRSNAELYDCLMKEFPDWLTTARRAGVLR
ncbi:VWA domain-containing protein [Streptomyces sp. NBC_01565]|uniref:VWA domain-containing protein n=1 Tax=Streptomyces sp. NBC_01565 TaxID=2975881 RepID=UPI00224CB3D8|nr:VWA domain-containing protein [Streptomyces sp. NBC_01565]MCX4544279.1 VWA domain-containing protein [Streptomyces sp. NBC_01565]